MDSCFLNCNGVEGKRTVVCTTTTVRCAAQGGLPARESHSAPRSGLGKAQLRPERPRHAPACVFTRRHDPPAAARRTCKSCALGGRGPDDLRPCSAGSRPPPSAIFHPLARGYRQRASRDFRGRLPSNREGAVLARPGYPQGRCARFLLRHRPTCPIPLFP